MAERGGFEPPVRQDRTTAFEAAAFNHSAISPVALGARTIAHPMSAIHPLPRSDTPISA